MKIIEWPHADGLRVETRRNGKGEIVGLRKHNDAEGAIEYLVRLDNEPEADYFWPDDLYLLS